MKHFAQKGFTLVELIIVIAIIGILAAAVLAALDPVDKIRAGSDSKVVGDIRQIYDAALRAYIQSSTLPATITGATNSIVSSGELKSEPKPPNTSYGSAYSYYVHSSGTDVIVCAPVQSKAQRNKALAGAATANVYIFAGKYCYTTSACGATLPAC